VSARVAYNWRGRFFNGITTVAARSYESPRAATAGWTPPLRYRANLILTLGAGRQQFAGDAPRVDYGVETRTQSVWANDVQIGVMRHAAVLSEGACAERGTDSVERSGVR